MNDTNAQPASESPERLLRVQKVVDACIERRIGGDELSDEQIIAENQELLPELRDELRNLAVIERARRRAASSDDRFGTTVAGGGRRGAARRPARPISFRAMRFSTRFIAAVRASCIGRSSKPRGAK